MQFGHCGDRISVGARCSAPSFLYSGYRVSFPWLKRPGRGVDHPPPTSAVGKERVELYRYVQPEPSWHVPGCGSCSVVDTKVVCICSEPPVWVGCAAVQITRFSDRYWPGRGVERRTRASRHVVYESPF